MKSARLSLTKGEILRGYKVFSRVIAGGQSLQRGAVRCFFSTVSGQEGTVRVGFSVSRSIENAVERNRARRWMKEAYRKNKDLLTPPSEPVLSALDVVFMLRVRGRLSRTQNSHTAVDQAVVALLKELHHHLADKP